MNKKISYPIRRVFIIDEITIILALLLAMTIRITNGFWVWAYIYDGVYVSILVTVCLFEGFVFLIYDNRKKPIFEMDPVENLMTVFKSRFILFTLSLVYVYIIRRNLDVSRIVLGLFFALSVILGYFYRMLYKKHHLSKHGAAYKRKTLKLEYPFPEEEEILSKLQDGAKYDEILIVGAGKDEEKASYIIHLAHELGKRVFCSLECQGNAVRNDIVTQVGEYAAIPIGVRKEKFDVFGIHYSIANSEEAVLHIIRHINSLRGKYICFSNVHTSVMAREHRDYKDVLNGAAFVFPDGNPISILQKKNGIIGAERVAGPDFMRHMFLDTMDGKLSHFFYGSTEETLAALKANLEKKYPGIDIRGYYSPPFRQLTEEEDARDVDMINASGADIIWIGLGAPKQEKWMQAHVDKVNGVMMGVGAGFDFHARTIKRAPKWIQRIGLEWLFRLFQDPKRLIKRYVVTNVKFVWYLMIEMVGKVVG